MKYEDMINDNDLFAKWKVIEWRLIFGKVCIFNSSSDNNDTWGIFIGLFAKIICDVKKQLPYYTRKNGSRTLE